MLSFLFSLLIASFYVSIAVLYHYLLWVWNSSSLFDLMKKGKSGLIHSHIKHNVIKFKKRVWVWSTYVYRRSVFSRNLFFVLLHSVIKYCNSMWHCRNWSNRFWKKEVKHTKDEVCGLGQTSMLTKEYMYCTHWWDVTIIELVLT